MQIRAQINRDESILIGTNLDRSTNQLLRILASYVAENSEICNFWTFWPVIQLINHRLKF